MFVCRLSKKLKHHCNHLSINRLWLSITIVMIACGATADVQSLQSTDVVLPDMPLNQIDCTARGTCAECTAAAPTCSWLLSKQTCNYTAMAMATTTAQTTTNQTQTKGQTLPITQTEPTMTAEPLSSTTTTTTERPRANPTDPLTIQDAASCPRFSVNYDRAVDTDGTMHDITVNISNDATGAFRALLARSPIACQLNGVPFPGKTAGAGSQIICVTAANNADAPSPISYFSVSANGTRLAFDAAVDHYLTANRHTCDVKPLPSEECADCFWDDDVYRYYCRWCPRSNKCTGQYEHCDIRPLNDFSHATTAVKNVLVQQCPAIRIESFEPMYGPWSGGTTVRIIVTNYKMVSEKRMIKKVTVAGRGCMAPSLVPKDGVIQCTIPPTNSSRMDSGPVEVTYVQWKHTASDAAAPLPAITLRSTQKFYFVEPDVTGMRPSCGPVAGGTQVTVVGNYLNAGNKVRVYVGDGNATCAVTAYGQNNVTCVTGAVKAPSAARVRLQFDDYLTVNVPDTMFEYTGDPTVDGGQTFRAIVSGGTRLPIRGRYLSCIKNPLIYVTHNGFQHTAGCEVRNATYMECRTPKIGQPVPSQPVAALEFGFQAEFGKNVMQQLQQPPVTSRYLLYPDPVYTDFETDGRRTVTINGEHLDRGYYVRSDLQVWFRNSSVVCNVTSVRPDRIVCKTPARARPLPGVGGDEPAVAAHDEIDVTFGNVLYNVKRKIGRRDAHMRFTTVFFSGITILSLVVTLVVAVVYCTKIALMASSQQTEMQSLCEQLTAPVAAVNSSNCTNGNTGTGNNNNDNDNDGTCNTTAAVNGGLKVDDKD